ncbi:phosphomannose isomerase type II C-terminal cupin domain [Cyanobium sp. NIES-981]|uniref:phosphomannose isomerase type II C-terminal cupin domain n=1 Tax=Cyanobium sp. NIES-981 TaxID=1851505 RepID=UPI0007DDC4F9|nr:phosphomannose isomerase type II C-terminal cupin domain [Cyanobium sp. NIES-981]SBO42871.1 Mannose-6-phosphate isomerase [Cyanobium sp. NIES-981]
MVPPNSPLPDPPAQRVFRPWGWFETLGEGPGYRVKRLQLEPGRRLSLQRHHHRCEHWVVVAGEGELEVDGTTHAARAGTSLWIPLGAAHRARADDATPLVIVEVQRGGLLSEEDIERLADDYGRGTGTVGPG